MQISRIQGHYNNYNALNQVNNQTKIQYSLKQATNPIPAFGMNKAVLIDEEVAKNIVKPILGAIKRSKRLTIGMSKKYYNPSDEIIEAMKNINFETLSPKIQEEVVLFEKDGKTLFTSMLDSLRFDAANHYFNNFIRPLDAAIKGKIYLPNPQGYGLFHMACRYDQFDLAGDILLDMVNTNPKSVIDLQKPYVVFPYTSKGGLDPLSKSIAKITNPFKDGVIPDEVQKLSAFDETLKILAGQVERTQLIEFLKRANPLTAVENGKKVGLKLNDILKPDFEV